MNFNGGTAEHGEINIPRYATLWHPSYNPSNFNNDIGFIHLSHDIPLSNPYVAAVALPIPSDASIDLTGKSATISGFGGIDDYGKFFFTIEGFIFF